MQNVGAIFRNCDGAGFSKIYLTGCTPTPPRSDISKTALWAENTIDWEYFRDPLKAVAEIQKQNIKIYSMELHERSRDYKELFTKQDKDICLILWNEVKGVQTNLLDISDKILMIPMLWAKESLNVSVAAGIVMYASV